MRARSSTLGAVLLALAAVAPACGEGQETISVRLTDFELQPARPEIDGPSEVRFRVRNVGQSPHALVVVGPKEEVEIEPLPPGGRTSFSLDLDEPGRYRWWCPVADHRERGMRGVITVDG